MRRPFLIVIVLACGVALGLAKDKGLPPGVKNTQKPQDVPPSPQEAARRFKAPEGFNVTLFAGEPHVCQPIALAFDDRGRLWVAECFSYPDWKKEGRDRILVFEDSDGDGKFDKRKVFWDKAYNLTGIEIGFGGIWACCAPHLLFIPDRDGDDVPDGKPQVVLDGWTLKAKHNIYNGLNWGPDGWLWGCHGITAESLVGPPGTPDEKRTRLNCSIWRYHPTRKVFEVVCHGTTNPWGVDFDEHGEAFFTNCVIAHLWHAVPGAHFQRMYGQDHNKHAYELMGATSDHLHWGGGHWTTSRDGKGIHSEAGGGHAHAGTMIYLGDSFPDEYRNSLFTCNLHGNRINRDRLVRKGSAYDGKHAPDFLTSDNRWFRGIALRYGPDGSVYVSDWCDFGECHDHDGVHRSSGRIYRIAYGKPKPPGDFDLAKLSDAELVKLQLHKNDWYVRHARRLLQERAEAGKPMQNVHTALHKLFDEDPDATRKLRALWALYVTGGAGEKWLTKQLDHTDEHIRSWAVRLLCEERSPSAAVRRKFADMAEKDLSGLVRLYIAAMLQRMEPAARFPIAEKLASHERDADDRNLPLMIWYGIEPAVTDKPIRAVHLAVSSRLPKLRRFIARRVTEGKGREGIDGLIITLTRINNEGIRKDLLLGLREGLKGHKSAPMPVRWKEAYAKLRESSSAEVRESAVLLAVTFNDAEAMTALRKDLRDSSAPAGRRAAALRALAYKGIKDLPDLLFPLLNEKAMRGPAIRALAAYDNADTPTQILKAYKQLTPAEKQDAISTLSSRPKYALALLEAVAKKRVPRSDVSAFTARQLQDLRDPAVSAKLKKVWGQVRQTPKEKKRQIDRYKKLLTADVLAKADLANGRLVYGKTCAQCHKLYGEGGTIGPDLTGSDRANLDYVLENAIDPGAFIGADYRLTNVYTKQGRLIPGIIVEETDRALTMQTATERLVIPKADVEERRQSPVSMMPEGQLATLTPEEVRDLVGYLAAKKQVPLRKE